MVGLVVTNLSRALKGPPMAWSPKQRREYAQRMNAADLSFLAALEILANRRDDLKKAASRQGLTPAQSELLARLEAFLAEN